MSAPSNALPRLRTLCTNSKKPKYSESFSWEIPRCGRSQLRKSDQLQSMDRSLYPPLLQNRACHFYGTRLLSDAPFVIRYPPAVTHSRWDLWSDGSCLALAGYRSLTPQRGF